MILALCIPAYQDRISTGHLYQLAGIMAAANPVRSALVVRLCAGVRKSQHLRQRPLGPAGATPPEEIPDLTEDEIVRAEDIALSASRLHINTTDTCYLDLARNMLLYTAVHRHRADWALFCDADTYSPNPEPIVGMLKAGSSQGAAVIAAPLRLRNRNEYNAQKPADTFLARDAWEGKVIEVDRVGTAFMAINCRWIREHWPADPPWFASRFLTREEKIAQSLPPDAPCAKLGEDFGFCDAVRAKGGSILLDGRFQPIHAHLTSEVAVYQAAGAEVEPIGLHGQDA